MNERIESYLKQHHCRDYFNAYGDAVEDEHYFMYREEVDGLIELIVRECMSVADLPKNASGQWDHLESSEVIAKHFGVE